MADLVGLPGLQILDSPSRWIYRRVLALLVNGCILIPSASQSEHIVQYWHKKTKQTKKQGMQPSPVGRVGREAAHCSALMK